MQHTVPVVLKSPLVCPVGDKSCSQVPDDPCSGGSTSFSAQAALVPTQAKASLTLIKGCTGQASSGASFSLSCLFSISVSS